VDRSIYLAAWADRGYLRDLDFSVIDFPNVKAQEYPGMLGGAIGIDSIGLGSQFRVSHVAMQIERWRKDEELAS
jgi:hypothetical protein